MHKLFSGKEHAFVPFFYYYKGCASTYTTTRVMLQHSSMNCSLLPSIQAWSSTNTMLDIFAFSSCIPRKPPLTQKQTLLVASSFHPVKIQAIQIILIINCHGPGTVPPCFANLSSQQSSPPATYINSLRRLSTFHRARQVFCSSVATHFRLQSQNSQPLM